MIYPASCPLPENPGRETATVLGLTRHRRPLSPHRAFSPRFQIDGLGKNASAARAGAIEGRESGQCDTAQALEVGAASMTGEGAGTPADPVMALDAATSFRCLGRISSPCLGAPAAAVHPPEHRRRYGTNRLPCVRLRARLAAIAMAARSRRLRRMGHRFHHVSSSPSPVVVSVVSQTQMSTGEMANASHGEGYVVRHLH